MSKPSGGNSTTTSSSAPPAWALQNLQNLGNAATAQSQQPLQQYTGPMIAGFNDVQNQAFNTINNSQGVAQPYINSAAQYMAGATSPLWANLPQLNQQTMGSLPTSGLNYTNQAANTDIGAAGQPGLNSANAAASSVPGSLSEFINPYTQQVVDATQNQFNNQNAQARTALQGNAISKGAYGGDREAIAQAELANQEQLAQAPTIAGLYNQGYQGALTAAQQQAQLESQTGLQGAQLGQSAAQQQAALQQQAAQQQLGLFSGQQQQQLSADQANAWLNSQAGFGMANLGQEAQASALQGASAQLSAGALGQQLQQEQLNLPYEQFQQQQAFPYQNLNWLSGLYTGAAGGSGGTSTTTSPDTSNWLQDLGGLGMSGLGLIGATGGFGGATAANPGGGWFSNLFNPSSASGAFNSAGQSIFHPSNKGGAIHRDAGGMIPGLSYLNGPDGKPNVPQIGAGFWGGINPGLGMMGPAYGAGSGSNSKSTSMNQSVLDALTGKKTPVTPAAGDPGAGGAVDINNGTAAGGANSGSSGATDNLSNTVDPGFGIDGNGAGIFGDPNSAPTEGHGGFLGLAGTLPGFGVGVATSALGSALGIPFAGAIPNGLNEISNINTFGKSDVPTPTLGQTLGTLVNGLTFGLVGTKGVGGTDDDYLNSMEMNQLGAMNKSEAGIAANGISNALSGANAGYDDVTGGPTGGLAPGSADKDAASLDAQNSQFSVPASAPVTSEPLGATPAAPSAPAQNVDPTIQAMLNGTSSPYDDNGSFMSSAIAEAFQAAAQQDAQWSGSGMDSLGGGYNGDGGVSGTEGSYGGFGGNNGGGGGAGMEGNRGGRMHRQSGGFTPFHRDSGGPLGDDYGIYPGDSDVGFIPGTPTRPWHQLSDAARLAGIIPLGGNGAIMPPDAVDPNAGLYGTGGSGKVPTAHPVMGGRTGSPTGLSASQMDANRLSFLLKGLNSRNYGAIAPMADYQPPLNGQPGGAGATNRAWLPDHPLSPAEIAANKASWAGRNAGLDDYKPESVSPPPDDSPASSVLGTDKTSLGDMSQLARGRNSGFITIPSATDGEASQAGFGSEDHAFNSGISLPPYAGDVPPPKPSSGGFTPITVPKAPASQPATAAATGKSPLDMLYEPKIKQMDYQKYIDQMQHPTVDPWMALLAGGAGMLAGRNRTALQSVGDALNTGMKQYGADRGRAQEATKFGFDAEEKATQLMNQAEIARQNSARYGAEIAERMASQAETGRHNKADELHGTQQLNITAQNYNREAGQKNRELDQNQQKIDEGTSTQTYVMGPDPVTGELVPGVSIFNSKKDRDPRFVPNGLSPVGKNGPSVTQMYLKDHPNDWAGAIRTVQQGKTPAAANIMNKAAQDARDSVMKPLAGDTDAAAKWQRDVDAKTLQLYEQRMALGGGQTSALNNSAPSPGDIAAILKGNANPATPQSAASVFDTTIPKGP